MKKMLFLIMLVSVISAFGVVNEWDPKLTPEEREQAKATNERIRKNNEERETEKEKQIEEVTVKYFYRMIKAEKRLKNNPEYQKEYMVATMQFIAAMDTIIAKIDLVEKKYIDEMHKLKEHYQQNPIENAEDAKNFKETFEDFTHHVFETNPKHRNKIEHLSVDYFIPVLAKYDTEMKKYLDEVNAIKAKYPRLLG